MFRLGVWPCTRPITMLAAYLGMTSSSCSISNSAKRKEEKLAAAVGSESNQDGAETKHSNSPSLASFPICENNAYGPPGCSSSQFVTSRTTPLTTIYRSSFLLCLATSSIEYSFSGILNAAGSVDFDTLPGSLLSALKPFMTGATDCWLC